VQRSPQKAWHQEPRIARKGKESSEKLGRHRWVVEQRTLAWLSKYRRLLTIRYERRDDIPMRLFSILDVR
jgi:hypothetical protein